MPGNTKQQAKECVMKCAGKVGFGGKEGKVTLQKMV